MRRARTWGWARMRRYDDPYNDLGPSSPHQSCPDCIIATRGYDFREEQRYEEATPGAPKDHPPVDSASERQATVRGTDCRLCQDGRAAERGRIRPQPSRSASENH